MKNLQEPFIRTVAPCAISSTINRRKMTEIGGMSTVKEN